MLLLVADLAISEETSSAFLISTSITLLDAFNDDGFFLIGTGMQFRLTKPSVEGDWVVANSTGSSTTWSCCCWWRCCRCFCLWFWWWALNRWLWWCFCLVCCFAAASCCTRAASLGSTWPFVGSNFTVIGERRVFRWLDCCLPFLATTVSASAVFKR